MINNRSNLSVEPDQVHTEDIGIKTGNLDGRFRLYGEERVQSSLDGLRQ